MATEFWSPTYTGNRFNDHSIPLDVLEDLGALQSLLIEIAKDVYYEENDKERVPNGFSEGVSLKLQDIEDGSSIPKIFLALAAVGSMNLSNKQSYYEKAKDQVITYVDAMNRSQSPGLDIPERYLHYFDRLGKNLYDDEVLDLSPNSTTKNAKLDKVTRSKVTSRIKSKTQETFEVTGSVPNIDKGKNNFILEKNGLRILCSYNDIVFDDILKAFNGYFEGVEIKLKGFGVFNHEFRLIELKSIGETELIYPPNIEERLEELKSLQDNWMDGQGKAPKADFIDWLKKTITDNLDLELLPAPRIYPTLIGGLQLEWASGEWDLSLTIDSASRKGSIHIASLKSNFATEVNDLNFEYADSWNIVEQYITKYFQSEL
jgi:hypothetical protein